MFLILSKYFRNNLEILNIIYKMVLNSRQLKFISYTNSNFQNCEIFDIINILCDLLNENITIFGYMEEKILSINTKEHVQYWNGKLF